MDKNDHLLLLWFFGILFGAPLVYLGSVFILAPLVSTCLPSGLSNQIIIIALATFDLLWIIGVFSFRRLNIHLKIALVVVVLIITASLLTYFILLPEFHDAFV